MFRFFITAFILLFTLNLLSTSELEAQSFQRRYTMMKGALNPDSILAKNLSFSQKQQAHLPNLKQDDVDAFASIDESTKIMVFLGTWCPDSQRNVPPFMNLVSAAKNQKISVDYVGVDRRKMDPDTLVRKYNVYRVPTFIVFQGNEEVGRLVERPKNSVEADIIKILRKID